VISRGLLQSPQGLKKQRLLEMANSGKLEEGNAVVSSAVLGTLGDSEKLIFVFGVSFQSPLGESAHSARRDPVVSFGTVSNNQLVQPVSRNQKDDCTPLAECGCS